MTKRLLLFALAIHACLAAFCQIGRFYSSDRLSSSIISCITQDSHGYIWIGTDYGLNKFDGYRFTHYLYQPNDSTSLRSNVVSCLFCDREGNLWVGTGKGLERYDYGTDNFEHYNIPGTNLPRITDFEQLRDGRLMVGTAGYGLYTLDDGKRMLKRVEGYSAEDADDYYSRIYEDDYGNFWKCGSDNVVTFRSGATHRVHKLISPLGTPSQFFNKDGQTMILCLHGILAYNNGQLTEVGLDTSVIGTQEVLFRTAITDRHGNVYIGTRGAGLYRLPKGSNKLERVENRTSSIDLKTTKIWTLMEDRQQNLWVGCQQKGLLMISNHKEQFSPWSFSAQNVRLGSSISSICKGEGGIIWCTVQGNGVYGFDATGRIVAHPASPASTECLYKGRDGNYWLGTDDGLYRYNPLTGEAQLITKYNSDKINDITDDGQGHVYISTYSKGFCIYDVATHELRNYNFYQRKNGDDHLCNNWIMCMMPDSKGLIWIGTADGVACFSPKHNSFKTLGWHKQLSGLTCYSIAETREGNIVMGTDHGLYIYYRAKNKVKPFPNAELLSDKVIAYIVEDRDGDLWCSTSMGIWQYKRRQQRFFGHVAGNGLASKEYVCNVGLHTADNMVYFGTNDGITAFDPASVKVNKGKADNVQLTGFLIGGKPVNTTSLSNGDAVTGKPVGESNHFTVSYLDNNFTLEFSLLNYANPENVVFEYRMNGGEWNQQSEGQNTISFNHMSPGTYRLEVRASDNGPYSTVESYTIVVRAPWYKSSYAYIVYLLLFFVLTAYAVITYGSKKRKQLDEEKMKFLINATHDIRSPLTLIMSPLAKLKKRLELGDNKEDSRSDSLRDVDIIERNANRILNLVNQILDVRKIDKQQMQLHCQETDLVGFVHGICKMFEYNATERHIRFTFNAVDSRLMAWFDRVNFDKVVTNLLSNAFKYSFDNGEIEVTVSTGHADKGTMRHYAELRVADTGMGLGDDNSKRIFDRFYQGGNSRSMHIEGTGIGLNLCKMIVDMHHGTIDAENRQDTKGSIFTVRIPLGNSHFTGEELEDAPLKQEEKTTQRRTPRSSYRVLIVDDDAEIGRYISSELGIYYHFHTCANGKEGLKELLTNSYDVVVSDVMMPEMDGFTMLRMIKTNFNISHIPVIMLTSKSDVGNRLEGLERGADAFIAKPFNMEELHMSIENVISNVRRLRGKFSGVQQPTEMVEEKQVKGNDEILMERVIKAINKNMGNSDFNVDMLTAEVGISRAQLHRKMKDITGIPASEFIRNIRLEQAARLLKEQKINITQVAYTVGFSNLAHFSTVFRKHFGISPKEYVEREND